MGDVGGRHITLLRGKFEDYVGQYHRRFHEDDVDSSGVQDRDKVKDNNCRLAVQTKTDQRMTGHP